MKNLDYVAGATISPEKLSWMETFLPKQPGTALDLGCGAGLYSSWLHKRGWRVHALDLHPPPTISGVQTQTHNLEEGLPFSQQTFDLILAWDVFEHVATEKNLWSDTARILQRGGILLGSVPHAADQRLHTHNLTYKHHIDKTHHREYYPVDLEHHMQMVALSPLRIELKGPVSPHILAEFVPLKSLRWPVAKAIGIARRLGVLSFGELYSDIFFAGKKSSDFHE